MYIHQEFGVPLEDVFEMDTKEVSTRLAYLKRRADLVNKAQRKK